MTTRISTLAMSWAVKATINTGSGRDTLDLPPHFLRPAQVVVGVGPASTARASSPIGAGIGCWSDQDAAAVGLATHQARSIMTRAPTIYGPNPDHRGL